MRTRTFALAVLAGLAAAAPVAAAPAVPTLIIGIGDPFAMPYVTIEAVLPIGGDRLAIVHDTNFGSRGRNPVLLDDSDFVEVSVPGLRGR